jgi:recombination protein RecA
MKSTLAVLEDALRARKLDRTLTSVIPPGKGDEQVTPAALSELDTSLQGGFPRGQLSELVGPPSSGRTTLLLQMLSAATHRGEIVALVDTSDRLDLASVVAAGVDLDRLLWIRGHAISRDEGLPAPRPQSGIRTAGLSLRSDALLDRTIERGLKAFNLVLQAGGFGVVALDLADASPAALHRLPFTTWLRVQRTLEGSETTGVLVASQSLGRSAGGLTLALDSRTQWVDQSTKPEASAVASAGAITAASTEISIAASTANSRSASAVASRSVTRAASSRSDRLTGLDVTVRVISPRRRVDGDVMIAATALR